MQIKPSQVVRLPDIKMTRLCCAEIFIDNTFSHTWLCFPAI